MKRAGILLPIFSLPSSYGIGDFGEEAYKFIDFLSECGQSIWQILPLTQTSFGDSPYQSPSAFAMNPYFIDPQELCKKGYVTEAELLPLVCGESAIDYGRLYETRYPFLKLAYSRFSKNPPRDFFTYIEKQREWLDDYALFMAIKNEKNAGEFINWDTETVCRENLEELLLEYREEVGFWKFLQYELECEWHKILSYAHEKGIKIMGDLPIYVAYDSADVWGNPEQFLLDEARRPLKVAGVPPDAFSDEGQMWGNPLYDWDYMRGDGYSWWARRFARAKSLYDIVRIDHFVGFSNYYAIPNGAKRATEGEVKVGVGYPLFEAVLSRVGKIEIVAEDLGMLQNGVAELLSKTGFPNMRVIQFSFDGENNPHARENHIENCVVYTGTHDNPTSYGYYKSLDAKAQKRARQKLGGEGHISDRFIAHAMGSVAKTVIIPMADYLRLGDEARLNAPSSMGAGNWSWRLRRGYRTKCLRERILALTPRARLSKSFKRGCK